MPKEQLPKLTQFKQGRDSHQDLLPSRAQALYKQQQIWAYPGSPSTPNSPLLPKGSRLYLHPPYIYYGDLCVLVPASHTYRPKQWSSFS